jgi:predicted nucleic acid-binding protein
MKHIFIDTDIILDFLGDRKPFSKHAKYIFLQAHKGAAKLYTSGNTITTAYYILCKLTEEKKARKLIVELLEFIAILPVTDKILKTALNSDFRDYEDAVQHFCALTEYKISLIVTRNLKDYKNSQIEVIAPDEFV